MEKDLYEMIADFIRKQIRKNIYKNMTKIPTEKEFVSVFGVHRNTVRKAINLLKEEGILLTVAGKGTFVTIETGVIAINEKYKAPQEIYDSSSKEVLKSEKRKIGDYYSILFQNNPEDIMYSIEKLYSYNGLPYILEKIFVPVNQNINLEEYDLTVFDINDIYEMNKIKLTKIKQTIEIIIIDERKANVLNLESGDSVIKITKKILNNYGSVIEVREQLLRGDLLRITNSFYQRSENY